MPARDARREKEGILIDVSHGMNGTAVVMVEGIDGLVKKGKLRGRLR